MDVTIVEAMEHLLPLEDEAISIQLERSFKKQGIKFITSAQEVRATGESGRGVVTLVAGGKEQRLEADKVLIGIGFQANVGALGLDAAGVATERGWVKTDERLMTSADGVYAIGDVTGIMNLAHVASAQGVMVVERLAGIAAPDLDYRHIPAATYSHPEVAHVGLTEKAAREAGYAVQTGSFPIRANGRAKSMNEMDGVIKLVSEATTGETLGLHMAGPMVSELIAEATLGMTLEMTPKELGWTVAAHPTLSECVKEAALAVHGEAIHFWNG